VLLHQFVDGQIGWALFSKFPHDTTAPGDAFELRWKYRGCRISARTAAIHPISWAGAVEVLIAIGEIHGAVS